MMFKNDSSRPFETTGLWAKFPFNNRPLKDVASAATGSKIKSKYINGIADHTLKSP